jgi:uncharacterized protein (TIGR02246 family)
MRSCNQATLLTSALAGAVLACAVSAASAASPDDASREEIAATLTQWKTDFNAGRANEVCDLFARNLTADFRGQPARGYDALCALLQSSLADTARAYTYELEIKNIQAQGDLAAVRLNWTLTVRQRDTGEESTTVEPGLDVFNRQDDGRWRIVRYLAYEE